MSSSFQGCHLPAILANIAVVHDGCVVTSHRSIPHLLYGSTNTSFRGILLGICTGDDKRLVLSDFPFGLCANSEAISMPKL